MWIRDRESQLYFYLISYLDGDAFEDLVNKIEDELKAISELEKKLADQKGSLVNPEELEKQVQDIKVSFFILKDFGICLRYFSLFSVVNM